MIVKYTKSPLKFKRYRVFMDNGKHYDFGFEYGHTYLDHKDPNKRKAYWDRHLGNSTEKILIENLVPSPALFSAMLLWGNRTNIVDNINILNEMWRLKHLHEEQFRK